MGKTVNFPRIVSLLPSGSEIVFELGFGDRLVGRSHDCDYPLPVKDRPVCSWPDYPSQGSSREIHRSAVDVLTHALSIYRVDVETIRSLRPTHIITQSQCRVCAISTDELERSLDEMLDENPVQVIDSSPESLEEVFVNIEQIGEALGVPGEGRRLVWRMKSVFDSVRSETVDIEQRPTVAHIEWIDPLMTGGHWVMSMIDWAGGENLFPDEEKRWIEFADLVEADPEKIVIAPCGFSVERTRQEMGALTSRPEWRKLQAVRRGEVYLCDGSSYFNRPGPRLADSVRMLAEIYHPSRFDRTFGDDAWVRF